MPRFKACSERIRHSERATVSGVTLLVLLSACSVDWRALLTDAAVGAGGEAGASVSASGAPGAGETPENLLENPAFDTNAEGWSLEPWSAQAWSPRDARGRSSSGSLSVANIRPDTSVDPTSVGSEQCLPVAGGLEYDARGALLITAPSGSSGGAIRLRFHLASLCTDAVVASFASEPVTRASSWTEVRVTALAPTRARSVSVGLVAVRAPDADPFELLFDDVRARELPPGHAE